MSNSIDGRFCYSGQWTTEKQFDKVNKVINDSDDFNDEYAIRKGLVIADSWNENHEKYNRDYFDIVENATIVDLGWYGNNDYDPIPYLYIKSSKITFDRFYPAKLDCSKLSKNLEFCKEWDEAIEEFCKVLKLPVPKKLGYYMFMSSDN